MLTKPEFATNLFRIKCAAAAAGGGKKAVDIIENFYIESLLLGKDEIYLKHKADEQYVATMAKADICLCFSSWFLIFALIFFITIWGWPGLLHLDEFYSHYEEAFN